MKKFSSILLAITLFALSSVVSAVPIDGTIDFSGSYTTDTGNINTATVFTFKNPITVEAATASFAPLSSGIGTVTYNALDINDPASQQLWSATVGSVSYSYTLNSITLDAVLFGGSFRVIKGIGEYNIGGETATGTWSFSTQGSGSKGIFSFSASNAPGPAPLILMGLGLFGIGVSRNLRRA